MKKSKVIGIVLALALTTLPGISLFAPNSALFDINTVSADPYKVTTQSTPLNFREKEGLSSRIIGSIPKGAIVERIGTTTRSANGYIWYRIKYNGTFGWACASYLHIYVPDFSEYSTEQVFVPAKKSK